MLEYNYDSKINKNISNLFFLLKTTINDLLICDGETPVSIADHLDYLYQAIKVFNIQQDKSNIHWVGIFKFNKKRYS